MAGLAFDDSDGNLWLHDVGGKVVKFDTTFGFIIPGSGWTGGGFPSWVMVHCSMTSAR